MKRMPLSIAVAACLVAVIAVTVAAHQAGAARAAAVAKPTAVAVVDLQAVLSGLDQRADAEAGLKAMDEEIKVEKNRRENEIKALESQLQGLIDEKTGKISDLEAAQALQEEIALKGLRYQGWAQFALNKHDIEKALLLQNLYQDIRKAIKDLSEANGYDIVLVEDGKSELTINRDSQVTREVQIVQQIAQRKVMFASNAVDITNHLIERMNNAYRAGMN